MAFVPYDQATESQRKSVISSSSPISKDNPNGKPSKGFVPYDDSAEKKQADQKIMDALSKITPESIFEGINKQAGVPNPTFNEIPDTNTSAALVTPGQQPMIPAEIQPAAPAMAFKFPDFNTILQPQQQPYNFTQTPEQQGRVSNEDLSMANPFQPQAQPQPQPEVQTQPQSIEDIFSQYKPKPSTFNDAQPSNDLASQYKQYLDNTLKTDTWVPDWMQVGPIKSAVEKGASDIEASKQEEMKNFQTLSPAEQKIYITGLNDETQKGSDWVTINNRLNDMSTQYDSTKPVSWSDKFSGAYTKAMMGEDTTENNASTRSTGSKFGDNAANVLGNIAGFIGPGAEGSIMNAADHVGEATLGRMAPILSKLPANAPVWLKNIIVAGTKGAATFGTMNAIQAGETSKTPGEAAKTIGEGLTLGAITGPLSEILPPSFTEALEKNIGGRMVLRGIPGAATFGTMSTSDVLKQYGVQKDQESKITAALQSGQISAEQAQAYMSQVNKVTPGQAVSEVLSGMATGFIVNNALHVLETNPTEYIKTKRFDADVKKFYSQVDGQYQQAQEAGTTEAKQYIYDNIINNVDAAKGAYEKNANKYPAGSQDNFNQAMDFLKVWITNEKRMATYGAAKTTFIPEENISSSPAGESMPPQEATSQVAQEPTNPPADENIKNSNEDVSVTPAAEQTNPVTEQSPQESTLPVQGDTLKTDSGAANQPEIDKLSSQRTKLVQNEGNARLNNDNEAAANYRNEIDSIDKDLVTLKNGGTINRSTEPIKIAVGDNLTLKNMGNVVVLGQTTTKWIVKSGGKTTTISKDTIGDLIDDVPRYEPAVDKTKLAEEIDSKTFEDVSQKGVNAIQFDHPTLKPYIQGEATRLKAELQRSQKGERFNTTDENGNQTITGVQRSTSPSIERILDNIKPRPTYDNIKDALQRIIGDSGRENTALAKRIELVIDDNLSNGVQDFDGNKIEANHDYIKAKGGKVPEENSGTGDLPFMSGAYDLPADNKKPNKTDKGDGMGTIEMPGVNIKDGTNKEGQNIINSKYGSAAPKHDGWEVTLFKDNKTLMVDTEDEARELVNYGEFLNKDKVSIEKSGNESKIEDKKDSPSQKIADKVKMYLRSGKAFNSMQLTKWGMEAYGSPMSEGKWSIKDATDAVELGVNQYLMEQKDIDLNAKDLPTVKANLEKLTKLLDLLPSQTNRTDEMVKLQQFSTPPTIAYYATWLANVGPNDVVIEPSAGIGGIGIFAKAEGAKVIVNEWDNRRMEILKHLGFDGFYNENAEQLNNVLPQTIKPTAVIMNPPFSTAINTSAHKTSNATKHIDQALKRLSDGGRLVAIVGKGMGDSYPTMKPWWKEVKSKYNVRANISVSGKNYTKYGTNWDIQIVVIDKTGPTPVNEEGKSLTLVDTFADINDAVDKLGGIESDRQSVPGAIKESEQTTGEHISSKTPGESKPEDQPIDTPLDTVDKVGLEQSGGASEGNGANGGIERQGSNVGGIAPVGSETEVNNQPSSESGNQGGQLDQSGTPSPTKDTGSSSGVSDRSPGERTNGAGDILKYETQIAQSYDTKINSNLDNIDVLSDIKDGIQKDIYKIQSGISPTSKKAIEELAELHFKADQRIQELQSKPSATPEPVNADKKPWDLAYKTKAAKRYVEYFKKTKLWDDLANLKNQSFGIKNNLDTGEFVGAEKTEVEDLLTYMGNRIKDLEKAEDTGKSDIKVDQKSKEEVKNESKKQEVSDAVYSDYVPAKLKIPGAKPHPGNLAESAAMAAVMPPDPTYSPNLPKSIISEGKLSIAQLEAVVYAGQAHAQMMPNDQRRGYFIGDGTGVGKGREISGIIMDNFRQGRKKAVWVSLNNDLHKDATRDWVALGGDPKDVMPLSKTKLATPVKEKQGIMYTTYPSLQKNVALQDNNGQVRGDLSANDSRYAQLTNWLGADFDGVIVFDEAHRMANAVSTNKGRGRTKPSKSAMVGVELQRMLPKARIVYVSATGATEVENLGYADRLGLWGAGTEFPDKGDFITSIKAGGLASMELVARDMKAMGLYISRSLSYDGVDYRTLLHDLTPDQDTMYNEMARAWQIVLKNMNKALEITEAGGNSDAKGKAAGQFWGSHQRFFNQVLTSLSMPSIITDIRQQLDNGNAVVLQIVNTNQAAQERELVKMQADDGELEDLDLTPREALIEYLQKSFPVFQYEEVESDDGKKTTELVVDREGNPVINPEAVAMRDAMIERVGSLKIPDGPLEGILNAFGVDNVAEKTGRNRRVVEILNSSTGRIEKKLQSMTDRSKDVDVDAFMDGKKDVLVFSKAGGTGKSYHADKTRKNQKHRIHYVIQAGWSASDCLQGLGRTNRTNQLSPPSYVLVTTNLKGQKRFISSIARRLDQLGALTKGQRQTGSQGMFQATDNLESEQSKDALQWFYRDLVSGQIRGFAGRELLEKIGLDTKLLDEYGQLNKDADELRNITKFLNRLLSLESFEQNGVFDAFGDRQQLIVERAIASGTLDMGLENFKADKVKIVDSSVVRKDPVNGAETKYIGLDASFKNHPEKYGSLDQTSKRFVGFFQNSVSKNVRAVYLGRTKTLENGSVVDTYSLKGPMTSDLVEREKFEAKDTKWNQITPEVSRPLWDAAVEKVPEYNTERIHLITGTLLPIWKRLPQGNVRVMRVQTDEGEILLGRLVGEREIDQTLRRLGAERIKGEVNYPVLAKQILEDGYTVTLANGWRLNRRLIKGEYRIELSGNDLYKYSTELKNQGLYTEIISYATRYFVPTGDKTASILEKMTKFRPIDEVIPPAVPASSGNSGFHGATSGVRIKPGRPVDGKAKPLSQIINELQNGFKVPVSTRRFMKKKYSGYYEIHPELVVAKWDNDLQTVAHEIGHHLDKLYNFTKDYEELAQKVLAVNRVLSLFKNKPGVNMSKWKADQTRLENEIRQHPIQEMIDNLPQIFHDSYERKELPHEAIAEFVKRYMINQSEAQLFGSKFYRTFESTVSKEYRKVLDKAADDISKWYSQDIKDKMKSTMQSYTKPDKINTDYLKRRVEQSLFDEFNSFKEFTSMAVDNNGKAIDADKNPYIMALNTKSGSLVQASVIITSALEDTEGNEIGASFKSLLSEIPDKNWDDYNAYLKGKHALDWWDIGKKVFPDDIDIEEVKNQVAVYESEHPEFVKAADKLYTWWHKFINAWLVKPGLLDGEIHQAMIDKYPHYVPLFRVMEKYLSPNSVNSSRVAKKGFSDIKNGIKRASKHGSTKDTHYPVEEFINEIYRVVQTVKRREVLLTIHDLYNEVEGLGFYLRRLPTKVNVDKFDARDIKSQVIVAIAQKHIDQMDAASKDLFFNHMTLQQQANFVLKSGWEESAEIVDNLIDDVIKKFVPEKSSKENDVIGVIDKAGNYIQYEVFDPLFLESLLSLGKHELPGWLKVFANITRMRKTLITGINPFFGTISNMPRDFQKSLSLGSVKNPFQFVYMYAESILDVIKNSDDFKQLKASGGGNVSKFSDTRDMHKEILNEIVPGRKWKTPVSVGGKTYRVYNPVPHGIEMIENYNDLIETMSRLPEWKSHDRSTYAGRMEALFQFNDITTNFQKKGSAAYSIDPILMFYNAGMQGLNKIWRAASRADIKDKKDFWSRLIRSLAYITVPLILTMIMYKNDPEYQEMSNYMKDSYFIYRNPLYLVRDKLPAGWKHFGDAPFNRIPLDKELGVMFGSLVRRAYNAVINKDPHAFKDFGSTVFNNLLPPVNPITDSLLGPIVDVERNKNWLGKPIISKALEFLDGHPEMQYDDTTSEIAKRFAAIAAFIPVPNVMQSPKKVDYLLTQYGGVLAQILQPATTQSKGWTSILDGLAKKMSVDPVYSTDIMNDFYSNRDEITGDRQKALMYGHKSLPKELEAFYTAYNNYSTDFSKYNKAIRLYEEDHKEDPEATAQKIRAIKAGMNLVADKFNTYYDSYKNTEEYKALKEQAFTDLRTEEDKMYNTKPKK